jgi:malate synthase
MAKEPFVEASGLRVERVLFDFVNTEALPGSGLSAPKFWGGLSQIVQNLGPRHRELLATSP